MPKRIFPLFLFILSVNIVLVSRITLAQDNDTGGNTIKIGYFTPPPSDTPTSTLTPTDTPLPTTEQVEPEPEDESDVPPLAVDQILYYSQRDSRWRMYDNPPDLTIGGCGCGETAIAMILSTYFRSKQYNPVALWDRSKDYYPGWCGTALYQHINIFAQYGVSASPHVYDTANPAGANRVLQKYLDADFNVIALTYAPGLTYGHYVILTQVLGNRFFVYDPWLLPGATQPTLLDSARFITNYITIKKV